MVSKVALQPRRNLGSPEQAGWQVRDFATAFAGVETSVGEVVLDSLLAHALEEHRLDDATFWQRVKVHSRMVRVMPGWSDRMVKSGVGG